MKLLALEERQAVERWRLLAVKIAQMEELGRLLAVKLERDAATGSSNGTRRLWRLCATLILINRIAQNVNNRNCAQYLHEHFTRIGLQRSTSLIKGRNIPTLA